MRKVLRVIVGAVALAAAVSVSAAPARNAVVVHDGACGLFDGAGNIVPVLDGRFSVTNNSGRMVQCRASDVPNSTGQALHFDRESTGVPCNAGGTLTDDWHQTLSASGQAVITCRVK